MKKLAEAGLALVMVGLEAINDSELDSYNKKADLNQNEQCVKILNNNNIICSGLFIVHQDMNKNDFKEMKNWISCRNIIPTISIFTPMKGSRIYSEYEDVMLTKNTDKQDLYHCILKPKHMNVLMFNLRYRKMLFGLMLTNSMKSDLYKCINITDLLFVIKVVAYKIYRAILF